MPKKREKSEISKHLSLVNVFFLVFITANLMIAILYLSNDEGVYSSPRSPTPSPVEPELPKCKADGYGDGDTWRPGCQITCAPGEHAYCRGASAGQQSSCECY